MNLEVKLNAIKTSKNFIYFLKGEINEIVNEAWIPKSTSQDIKVNILLQSFILMIVLAVIYWDFHQFNLEITPLYITVKGLVVATLALSIVMTYFKIYVNLWPILDMLTLLIYAFYGMVMIHFTYCFSFWEVYLTISILFKFSRKIYIFLMATGITLNYYGLLLSAEPEYIKDGMSFKPDMTAGTLIVYILSIIIYFVVTKKKQALYDMQERFASIGKQSSYVFHEIKKPINRLINSSPIYDQDLKRVNNIILNVELMLRNSEVFSHSFRPFKLKNIFQEIEKDFKDFFELYAIRFEFIDHHDKDLMANEDLIYQVFTNLTANAVEAISQDKSPNKKVEVIRVTIKKSGAKVEISFKNTGPVIPAGIQHKIFNPFVSTKEKEYNSGLGLSFCKNIIEGHLGEIELVNHKDGPEFIITF